MGAVRAFITAARHCSFKDAAAELCVTPGAVSRQIQALEKHFGVTLFERSHRTVRLTEQGARYFTRVAELFLQLQAASDEIVPVSNQLTVRLDSVPTLAMHWLLPRLPEFQAAYPAVEISLVTNHGPVDRSGGFDLAIRRDLSHFTGLDATRLMTEYCMPVCSPAYAARMRLRKIRDLGRCTAIQIRVRDDLWPVWAATVKYDMSTMRHRLVLDHTFFALQAAEDSLGVAVVPLQLAERQLARGRLIAPLGPTLVESGAYFAVEPSAGISDDTARLLVWLREAAHRWEVSLSLPYEQQKKGPSVQSTEAQSRGRISP